MYRVYNRNISLTCVQSLFFSMLLAFHAFTCYLPRSCLFAGYNRKSKSHRYGNCFKTYVE